MTFIFIMVFWVFSVCLHEFGHAVVAYIGGDKSVKDKGYLSMNPVYYVDPTHSIVMPMVFLALGGIGLPGGAVYINDHRLYNRYWSVGVSLAGPAANLLFAVVLGFALQFDIVLRSPVAPTLAFLAWLQISAVVLNLLPIPPLDGYRAMSQFLSPQTRFQMDSFSQFGPWLLLALFWFSQEFNAHFFGAVTNMAHHLGVPPRLVAQGWTEFFFWKIH